MLGIDKDLDHLLCGKSLYYNKFNPITIEDILSIFLIYNDLIERLFHKE